MNLLSIRQIWKFERVVKSIWLGPSWWSNREKGLSRAEPSLCLRTSVNDRLESPPINEEPTPASILSFLP